MTQAAPVTEFFTAGGTLPPDAPSYVKRPTDDELFKHVLAGEFCYVLTPRQMGKSSLMIRTAQRLSSQGVRSAVVDLTAIGTVESEDQWYKGILTQIKRRLRLGMDPVAWWEQRKDIPNTQKFVEFFEEALGEIKERIVIFIDEIDTTLELDFRDNFFAGIRSMYNARAERPSLRRITFVLLGVASPSDLVKDRNRTPFNIGQEFLLKPFNRKDANMLAQGLEAAYPGLGTTILNRIFYWTNGHPYLTQKLCQCVVDEQFREYTDDQVDRLVERLFISQEASRETNLQYVRDNILSYPDRKAILSLYKKILRGNKVQENKNSLSQNRLKLSGLVRTDGERLIVSNRIYSKVFDQKWVNKYTEVNWSLIVSVALGVIVILLAYVIYHDAVMLPRDSQAVINNLSVYKENKGIKNMADLFRMRPYIFPNEYEYKAMDTFFNAFNKDEQLALISVNLVESEQVEKEDYRIVVARIYSSLADVDRSGQTTELLAAMRSSLELFGLTNDPLYEEIVLWLEARRIAAQDLQMAREEYSLAINLNQDNPATHFERARIYTDLGQYPEALDDYEKVVIIVPESDIEPTQISTQVVDPRVATLIAIRDGTVGLPDPKQSQSNEISSQPGFFTRGQRVTAVFNDIMQNSDLYSRYKEFGSKANPVLATSFPSVAATSANILPQDSATVQPTTTFTSTPGSLASLTSVSQASPLPVPATHTPSLTPTLELASATLLPASGISPEEFIIHYFDLVIHDRDFTKGFSLLTPRYQKEKAQGWESYVKFWDSTTDWQYSNIQAKQVSKDRALVTITYTIYYNRKIAPSLLEGANYCLVKTDTPEQWQIDIRENCP